jgi:hypothetical protein
MRGFAMHPLRPFLLAGLLLITGLLVGCDRQPVRMKNQPTNLELKDRGVDKKLPDGQTKHFTWAE